ncbi:hypothetical protein TTHERM_000444389 (macronuclear) [Tetrahymena thermophila SB210]|uniref:Uncharacterized protein n=1 Tax=Tetrahymena thermophila (strain SB210) TaxID=312017 RepID=W7WZR5_TETTS|nr:hypothetical protein TTHERM_000444389 [Tetrahymena thermophila SB210]EWS72335.1 hypothetical protein TTHERM_000444389 [Tetrahymena thermophila SB210]|eukprot:XP_012655112.1 hypothetical protein TTHERM_000444389 [Tetrahymena thermophila SB210]
MVGILFLNTGLGNLIYLNTKKISKQQKQNYVILKQMQIQNLIKNTPKNIQYFYQTCQILQIKNYFRQFFFLQFMRNIFQQENTRFIKQIQ